MSRPDIPRTPFHQITADDADLDEAAEALARRKGIPTLTAPEQQNVSAAPFQPFAAEEQPAAQSTPAPRQPAGSARAALCVTDTRREQPAEPSSQEIEYTSVKCRCPDYLLDQLHLVARRGRVTISHLILEALRAQGFFIREEDMVPDGRRIRGSRIR